MSSIYAQKGSSGGSVYAQKGSSTGSVYAQKGGGAPAPARKGHGGLLGAVENAAHWTAQKAGLAAHDVKTIPGGTIQLAKDEYGALKQSVKHPWVSGPNDPNYVDNTAAGRKLNADIKGMYHATVASVQHPLRDPFQTGLTALAALGVTGGAAGRMAGVSRAGSLGEAARAAVRTPAVQPRLLNVGDTQVNLHPSANPTVRAAQGLYDKVLQRGLNRNPEGRVAVHANKRIGGAIRETGRYQERMREVPAQMLARSAKKLGATKGRQRVEQAALELTSTNTAPEAAAAYHLAQAEKGVNPALNRLVAKLYTTVHQRGMLTTNEHGDVIVNAADHPKLAVADARLAHVQGRGDQILSRYGVRDAEALQAAVNAPGKYRAGAKYEVPTAAKEGVPSQSLLKARGRVTRLEALHQRAIARASETAVPYPNVHTRTGRPVANSLDEIRAKHPKVEIAASENDHGITLSMIRTAEGDRGKGLARKALADLTAYADKKQKPLALTPEPVGGGLTKAQLAKWYRAQGFKSNTGGGKDFRFRETMLRPPATPKAPKHVEVAPGPKTPGAPSALPAKGLTTPTVTRLGGALSVARDELARLEQQATSRVKPTGIVGGAEARPGRGYVSYAGTEPRAPRSAVASSAGPVVGEAKAPVTSHANQGANIAEGRVPNDITGQAARHYHQIVRFVNTTEHRNAALNTGSAVRRSSHDVLVKIPGESHAKIPAAVNEILGKSKLTADDVQGLHAALQAYKEDLVPGLQDNFAKDRAEGIGTQAPEGHYWVDKNVLGDLAKPGAGPRGRIARSVDNVNSAVTAATVYFKIGHVGTRAFTNAATNIIQGSAQPLELAKSVKLWQKIGQEDRLRALAAAGQHGFAAMPHEGTSIASRVAGTGANFWARRFDAPFRFNQIAYEARKEGITTPTAFHQMLDQMENPQGLHPTEAARVDRIAKASNREGIAYDRLNDFERKYLTRAVWFYPWLKGTAGFAANTAMEHPFKAATLGKLGEQGRQTQQQQLGDLPSYEAGLFQLAHPDAQGRPLVADFSTFSPFATPADMAQAVERPAEISGFLNPAATAGTNLIFGLNAQGGKSTSPIEDALASLASPTPEAQVLTAFLQRHKSQAKRMFPKSSAWYGTHDPVLRALIGPGMVRRLNPEAAHSAAARQRSGR